MKKNIPTSFNLKSLILGRKAWSNKLKRPTQKNILKKCDPRFIHDGLFWALMGKLQTLDDMNEGVFCFAPWKCALLK